MKPAAPVTSTTMVCSFRQQLPGLGPDSRRQGSGAVRLGRNNGLVVVRVVRVIRRSDRLAQAAAERGVPEQSRAVQQDRAEARLAPVLYVDVELLQRLAAGVPRPGYDQRGV